MQRNRGGPAFLTGDFEQFFPKTRLDAQDLGVYTGMQAMPVTIEGISYEEFKSRQTGTGAQSNVENDIVYTMHVREFSKPIKITKTRMRTLGDFLGTRKVHEWTGRVVLIQVFSDWITEDGKRKQIWTIEFVGAGTKPPNVPAKQDITGAYLEAQERNALPPGMAGQDPENAGSSGAAGAGWRPPGARTALPQGGAGGAAGTAPAGKEPEAVNGWVPPRPWPAKGEGLLGGRVGMTIANELHRRGLDLEKVITFLKGSAANVAPKCEGKELHEFPELSRVWLQTLCKSTPATRPAMSATDMLNLFDRWFPAPAAPEIINKETGEVTPVDEDDIPF